MIARKMNGCLKVIQKIVNIGQKGIPILMYHYVDNIPVPSAINPDLFKKEMAFIKKNCNPIIIGDLIEYIERQKTLPDNSLLITFDDGTADFYYNALPILKELNIPTILYIATGYLGSYLPSPSHNWKYEMLGWEEVEEISQCENIEIGAHSVTHPRFNLISNDKIRYEVIKSKEVLEKYTEKPVIHFSYPKGYTNREIIEIVKDAGYKTAVTSDEGYVKPGDNFFALKRIWIHKQLSFNGFTSIFSIPTQGGGSK